MARSPTFAAILCALALASAPAAAQFEQSEYWIDTGEPAGRGSGGVRTARGGRARTLDEAVDTGSGLTLGGGGTRAVPPSYSVHRGDTLWDISGHFYGNPWEWPRVWSFNPEITNPHWIYPDQVVRLLPDGAPITIVSPGGPRIVVRPGVESGTLFLREQGWLDREALETAGEIVGSPDDHMMLSPYDQLYIRFDELPQGQSEPTGEYTVFRAIEAGERNSGEEGTLVRIIGTVRIDSWDGERRMARATILEALDPIERGYHVAALPRRFDVVPPVRSEIDLDAQVVATLMPQTLVGDQQIVFVGSGEEEGVRMGYRFFVVRAGDDWRHDLSPTQEEASTVSPPGEQSIYPDEVIAEARVVSLRPHSAGLLVTRATRPVLVGDRAQLRRGY
jgi:hypothetical protein